MRAVYSVVVAVTVSEFAEPDSKDGSVDPMPFPVYWSECHEARLTLPRTNSGKRARLALTARLSCVGQSFIREDLWQQN